DKPTADFQVASNVNCSQDPVQFNNQSSIDKGQMGYNWKFGDGAQSNTLNPTHVYETADTFTIKLIVTSNRSCVDSTTAQIALAQSPTADFDHTKQPGGFVQFSANDTTLSDYQWDFDDGNTASVATPDHQYSQEGVYYVELKATKTNGCNRTNIDTVPVFNITALDESGMIRGSFEAYPNPFKDEARIKYRLLKQSGSTPARSNPLQACTLLG
ncbi:MAG: hypothetical protein BRD49_01545, partial [Bacteroidetes bacterium SW_10_40_5]